MPATPATVESQGVQPVNVSPADSVVDATKNEVEKLKKFTEERIVLNMSVTTATVEAQVKESVDVWSADSIVDAAEKEAEKLKKHTGEGDKTAVYPIIDELARPEKPAVAGIHHDTSKKSEVKRIPLDALKTTPSVSELGTTVSDVDICVPDVVAESLSEPEVAQENPKHVLEGAPHVPAPEERRRVTWGKYNHLHFTYAPWQYNRRPLDQKFTDHDMLLIRKELDDLHKELFPNQVLYTVMPSVRTVPETTMQTFKRRLSGSFDGWKGHVKKMTSFTELGADHALIHHLPRPSVELRDHTPEDSSGEDSTPPSSPTNSPGISSRLVQMFSPRLRSSSVGHMGAKERSTLSEELQGGDSERGREERKGKERERSKSPMRRLFDLSPRSSTSSRTDSPRASKGGSGKLQAMCSVPNIVVTQFD